MDKKCTLLAVFLTLFTGSSSSQRTNKKQEDRSTHGTVNIFLANAYGLVAVTDSRLSSSGTTVGEDQKLFIVDDHTICAIAGWYSSPGPSADDVNYPAYSAISNIVRALTSPPNFVPASKLEDKLDRLSRIVGFTLQMMQELGEVTGEEGTSNESYITLGTFEDGHFKIASSHIALVSDGVTRQYKELNREVLNVSDPVVYLVRGMPDIAEPILKDPTRAATQSPIIDHYRELILRDRGRSLSVQDMTQLGRKLETLTSVAHSAEVGGPVQMATIVDGKASLVETYSAPSAKQYVNPSLMMISKSNTIMYSAEYPHNFLHARILAIGNTYLDVDNQPLDDMFVFASTFKNTELTYNGSSTVYFDQSNVLLNCKLVVGKNVDLESAFIRQIRKDFPNLKIEMSPK